MMEPLPEKLMYENERSWSEYRVRMPMNGKKNDLQTQKEMVLTRRTG